MGHRQMKQCRFSVYRRQLRIKKGNQIFEGTEKVPLEKGKKRSRDISFLLLFSYIKLGFNRNQHAFYATKNTVQFLFRIVRYHCSKRQSTSKNQRPNRFQLYP